VADRFAEFGIALDLGTSWLVLVDYVVFEDDFFLFAADIVLSTSAMLNFVWCCLFN